MSSNVYTYDAPGDQDNRVILYSITTELSCLSFSHSTMPKAMKQKNCYQLKKRSAAKVAHLVKEIKSKKNQSTQQKP